jgi:uroporphyrinogen-III synthase
MKGREHMPAPRVLVTRSPHQASALADQLRAVGAEPILIPTIELADPSTFAPVDAALAQLDHFHWLLFTSANAVGAFTERLQAAHGKAVSDSRVPASCRIAAIGAATARALEAVGFHVDLVPPQSVAESLAEALLPYAHQSDGSPTRFLLLRAEVARDVLPEALRAAGADVTIAPVYRNVVPIDSIAALSKLFSTRDNWPAAMTFTSSSTAANLLALLEASGLSFPQEILRISIGPVTSQTLRDLSLPPHAEAAAPSIPSLVAEVAKALGLTSVF